MSEQPTSATDVLERLISASGKRVAPPAQAYERALAAATRSWQTQVRRRRWRVASSLAAGITVAAIGVGVAVRSVDSPPAPSPPIANASRVIGDVRVRTEAFTWRSLSEAAPLSAGAVVRVETASAAALQVGAAAVRIAGDAEIVLESPSRLRLRYGKVYVDTGGSGSVGAMLVVTDTISASDVGTQFEVQERDDAVRVRVREGAVLLEHAGARRRGAAGDQIDIDRAGVVRLSTIRPNDPDWRWIESLATAPDIDNQPLTVLLAWVARETGAPVRFATPAVERKATVTILHGSIRNLEPIVALSVMLATTDLRHEVLPDGTIMIK
jgi:ferric-dicitrate binding protein FerR (iron transport regulator)